MYALWRAIRGEKILPTYQTFYATPQNLDNMAVSTMGVPRKRWTVYVSGKSQSINDING